MTYEELHFKIPEESPEYPANSAFIIQQIISILDRQTRHGDNKIILNTNLKRGLPLENINKIAGPMIEAWAGEVFAGIRDDLNNEYDLINVEAQERLGMADIILQFRKGDRVLTGNVDVKATADDIPGSGKGPQHYLFCQDPFCLCRRSGFYVHHSFHQTSGLFCDQS